MLPWTWFRRRASSTRLGVDFSEALDVHLFVHGMDARVIRLTAGVRLRTQGRWGLAHPAIVDPGSPNCVLPHFAWSVADFRILVARALPLGGIGGGVATAPLGEVTLAVDDGIRTSHPLSVRAFLLPDDSEPLLLGFQDILTHAALHCDYPRRVAYLEFPTGA